MERLWTVEEVAEHLRVHRRYVENRIRTREIRAIKIGGSAGWRIEEKDLERFIRAHANISRVRGD